ncbi:hypothetical protein BJ912DRAFT_1146710 [Pholiota molesta]|nr:hypothetical protein BJ912DRAFT_1146710 [Pholiota molesta]
MSKIILVTGANAGIGFELTRLLAEKGHTVYLGARREASGKRLPGHHQGSQRNDRNAEGHLDVLVNNAGIARFDAIRMLPLSI